MQPTLKTGGEVDDRPSVGTAPEAQAAACDGACLGNPGPGGWGWLIHLADGRTLEATGSASNTTNNRMELEAAAAVLEALCHCTPPAGGGLVVRTDSRYVIDGLKAVPHWQRNGWITTTGTAVKNRDLWERLAAAAAAVPWAALQWVKGHNGHADNERADALASAAAQAAAASARAQQQPVDLAAEMAASGIAPDVAAINVAAFGPGTGRHWEDEREELLRYKLHQLQTAKLARNGHVQAQAGLLTESLHKQRQTYRHLQGGGWRTLSDALPGRPAFDQWKPALPRQRRDKPGRSIKYEAPPAFPDGGGLLLPRVPDRLWRLICERQQLPFPADRSGGFWAWALATPALELTIVEGFKKSLASITAGIAAVALPGVTMGRRVDGDGNDRLIAELQLLAASGRRWRILFDADRKGSTAAMVHGAAIRLANGLLDAGCTVAIARLQLPDGAEKLGLDDLLAAEGEAAVLEALEQARPHPRRIQLIGARHFKASDIPKPEIAALVAMDGGMGSNKTGSVADKGQQGVRIISITHRRALADQQGERLGVPVLREGSLQSERDPARGFAVVFDSSHPGGSCHVKPSECKGKLLFIDEADAVLLHALTARTEIRRHRIDALKNLVACVRAAAQVVIASAHLTDTVIEAFEQMRGHRAVVVRSSLRPAAGRELEMLTKPCQLRDRLQACCRRRQPFIFHTGSKETHRNWGPAALQGLIEMLWPGARMLVMNADTIREPDHPASRAIREPSLLLAYDVVLATPVLETGFSIEDPAGHFKAVLAYNSGHLAATAVAQSLGRLRSNAPRCVYVTTSGKLKANGATDAAQVSKGRKQTADHVLDLFLAGRQILELNVDCFYSWWAELIAGLNREARCYRVRVQRLMQREGYRVREAPDSAANPALAEAHKEALEQAIDADAGRLAAMAPTDPVDLQELEKRQNLTAEQRDRRDRGRITADLGIKQPSAEQVKVWREGPQRSLLRSLLLRSAKARRLYQQQLTATLPRSAAAFKPDLADHFRVLTAVTFLLEAAKGCRAIKTLITLQAGDEINAALLAKAQDYAQAHYWLWRERIGFHPGNSDRPMRPLEFGKQLLELVGLELKAAKSRKGSEGSRDRGYAVRDPLAALNRSAVEAHLLQKMESPKPLANTGIGVHKSRIKKEQSKRSSDLARIRELRPGTGELEDFSDADVADLRQSLEQAHKRRQRRRLPLVTA